MMNIKSFAVRALVFTALFGCVRFTLGADRPDHVIPASALRPTMEGSFSAAPIAADFRSMPKSVTNVRPYPATGGIAGTPPGTNVYSNEIPGGGTFYSPQAGDRMADDLILASGGCDIVYYNLGVFSAAMTRDDPPVPTIPYDVTVELWDDDPCEGGSLLHTASFTNIVVDEQLLLEVFPHSPITGAPDTVWLAATFSTDDAGWIIAEQAELGTTNNLWSENHTTPVPPTPGCTRLFFNSSADPHAGFWANVNCDLDADPTGACCDGTTCTEVTEVDCATGTWQGAFTGCDPSPCVTGACCTDNDFMTCSEVTEAACDGGFFDASAGCAVAGTACGPNHVCFANDFNTGFFFGIPDNIKWADDAELAPGPPRELLGVEVTLTGGGEGAPSTFSATIEVWSNNDNGTPDDPTDDTPAALIPGVSRTVSGISADLLPHDILVSAPPGVMVSGRIWIVVTTDSDFGGILLAGFPAKPGISLDQFAMFNAPEGPNAWTPGFFFSGFDGSSGCPGDTSGATICPAGSSRMRVYCKGDFPTGACCDDITGSCTSDVERLACAGRWEPGLACRANPFTPACGVGACCFPNPINPDATVCLENTVAECVALNGSFSAGLGCPGSGAVAALSACPIVECLGQEGNCFDNNGSPGCNHAFCCERVCARDDFCCSNDWDEVCVGFAESLCTPNDDIADAIPIAGEGVFEFNSSFATPDGPNHSQCAAFGDTVIDDDVWFCWTANCTDVVLFETCNGNAIDPSNVDTKIAAYDGCGDPTNGNLEGCSDDTCGFQSSMVFQAQTGQDYLLRVGTFPGMPGGPGALSISCGVAGCPGDGDCCAGTGSPGCDDPLCCATICACDSFCCTVEWDTLCAGNGFNDSGCGAAALCTNVCGEQCPPATSAGAAAMAVDPPDGVVDAGIPHDRNDAAALRGISMIEVDAPMGAGLAECWTLCESATAGSANSVVDVIDNGGGQYTLVLDRPLTPNAVTTISYAGDGTVLTFTTHPGNVDAGTRTTAADVQELIDIIDGSATPVWGIYSGDIDRSGAVGPGDVMEAIDLINGADAYEPWLNTAKPTADGVCP